MLSLLSALIVGGMLRAEGTEDFGRPWNPRTEPRARVESSRIVGEGPEATLEVVISDPQRGRFTYRVSVDAAASAGRASRPCRDSLVAPVKD